MKYNKGKDVSDGMQALCRKHITQKVYNDPQARRELEAIINEYFAGCKLAELIPSELWSSKHSVIVRKDKSGQGSSVSVVIPEPLDMWLDEQCLEARMAEMAEQQDNLPGVI